MNNDNAKNNRISVSGCLYAFNFTTHSMRAGNGREPNNGTVKYERRLRPLRFRN